MNQLLKIDSIMYRVKNLEKASEFYQKQLGLQKVWEDLNSQMIGFKFKDSDSEIVITTDKIVPNYSFSFLVESVNDFCKSYEGKILRQPFNVRPGMFAVLADQDGNEIPIIDLTKFGGKPKYD